MIINKITTGFVIQSYDTDTGRFVGQNFVAGDQVEYELPDGGMVDDAEMAVHNFGPGAEEEPYLPFDMKQPE